MSDRGNPKLQVRLDDDFAERLQEAFPSVKGRSGGVALAVRQLLHLVLDEPVPKQYGEVRRNKHLDEAEAFLRDYETENQSVTGAVEVAIGELLGVLKEKLDPVDSLRAYVLLGKWTELSWEMRASDQ